MNGELQTNNATCNHECFWASLNFFNDSPVDRPSTQFADILAKDYQAVHTPTQLGDLVFLREGNTIVHGCVYLAGDLVFTKNGMGRGEPFVIEKLENIRSYYSRNYGDIKLAFCRRKGT